MDNLKEFYIKNHKKLILVPVAMLAIAIVILAMSYSSTGEFFERDVSLKGGITITAYTEQEINEADLTAKLEDNFGDVIVRKLTEFGTSKQIGFVVETSSEEEKELKSIIEETTNIKLTEDNFSIEVVGSSLGESFYKQMVKALIFAFIFMAVMVLIIFRTLTPSFAVVFAALSDIIITLAVISITNMRLSSAGIAALLLLIGYSIDTDILLTTRVLRRKEGSIMDGIFGSMKTGLTMTITTILALTLAYTFATSLILQQIFLIIIIGLIIDIIITYLMNAPVLIMYSERKEKTKVYSKGDEE